MWWKETKKEKTNYHNVLFTFKSSIEFKFEKSTKEQYFHKKLKTINLQ